MKLTPLKDFATILNGFAFNSQYFDEQEGKPLIRIRDILRGRTNTFYKGSYDERYIIRKGDYLIGMDGEFNINQWQGADSLLNQRVCKLEFDDKVVCPRYIFYLMKRKLKEIELKTPSVTVKHLSSNKILDMSFNLPPLKSQEIIASILLMSEDALEKRRQTLRLADDFLKSAFSEMFGEPGANPKKFKRKPIKDLVKAVLNEDPKKFPDKKYSYVDISSIDNKLKRITEVKKMLGTEAPSRARQLLQSQDILVSTVRPNLNAVGNLPNDLDNPIGSTGFCVLRANKEFIYPEYLFEICKTPFFIKSLSKVAKGASYPAVSDNDVLRISIPVSPVFDQQKFADLVQKVERLKEKQKQSETQLQNLFNSLMQRAFRGEL